MTNHLKKHTNLLKMFFSSPTYLIFYVTSQCNSRCKMCFNWKYNTKQVKKDELSLEEIQKISKSMGYLQYITLGGGEPFLRKDIDEISKIFYDNNKTRIFSIPTNCLTPKLIAERTERMLKKCPDAIFKVSMSIDGVGKLHDYIRGVSGNFERVNETYKLLDGLRKKYPNLEVSAGTTFSAYNQDRIKEIHDYVTSHFKLDLYSLTFVRGNTKNAKAKKVDLAKYEEAIKLFEKDYKGKKIWRNPYLKLLSILPILTRKELLKTVRGKKRTYECYAIKKMLVLDSFGNVLPCEMLSEKLGNLRNYSYDVKLLLRSKKAKRLLKFIKERKCNCTWECAIQNGMAFDWKKYPSIIAMSLGIKNDT